MTSMRITAHMGGPVVLNPAEGIHLDGVLLYYVILEHLGEAFFSGPQPTPERIAAESTEPHPAMPLGVEEHGKYWVYRISRGELVGRAGTERHHLHKRFDEAAAQHAIESGALELGRKTKVQTNSGPFRSYRIPRWSELCERIVWYAEGDLEEVRRLLTTHATHLGKQRQSGMGVVAGWDVEAHDEGERRWLWRDQEQGLPARAIPVEWLPEIETTQPAGDYFEAVDDFASPVRRVASIRPPHWLPEHHVECLVP